MNSYTVDTANKALVLVKKVVSDVVQEYNNVIELQDTIDLLDTARESTDKERSELMMAMEKLKSYTNELTSMGITIHDINTGEVWFPTTINGE